MLAVVASGIYCVNSLLQVRERLSRECADTLRHIAATKAIIKHMKSQHEASLHTKAYSTVGQALSWYGSTASASVLTLHLGWIGGHALKQSQYI